VIAILLRLTVNRQTDIQIVHTTHTLTLNDRLAISW